MSGPFTGLKVIDLTTVFVGPYSTQLLADLGAEVIKVEAPDGDLTRMTGPARNAGMTSSFMQLNRNKRSIAMNLKHPDSKEVIHRIIKQSHVLVENFRPGF